MSITSKPLHYLSKTSKNTPSFLVETNGMSTQVFGDYDNVMTAIQKEMKNSFSLQQKVVFNMKVINSHLQEKPSI